MKICQEMVRQIAADEPPSIHTCKKKETTILKDVSKVFTFKIPKDQLFIITEKSSALF